MRNKNSKNNLLDISEDFSISRYGNGVKLLTPLSTIDDNQTVSSLSTLPLSIYFLNKNSSMAYANSFNLNLCGIDSLKILLGKTAHEVFKQKTNKESVIHDNKVMSLNQSLYFDETITHVDGSMLDVISLKLPVYNDTNQIVGLFGCSITIQKNSLAQALTLISTLPLFANPNATTPLPGYHAHDIYFTKRETEILEHILKGRTARCISQLLRISPRTVETHLEHIKNKAMVATKAELIEKFIA